MSALFCVVVSSIKKRHKERMTDSISQNSCTFGTGCRACRVIDEEVLSFTADSS